MQATSIAIDKTGTRNAIDNSVPLKLSAVSTASLLTERASAAAVASHETKKRRSCWR